MNKTKLEKEIRGLCTGHAVEPDYMYIGRNSIEIDFSMFPTLQLFIDIADHLQMEVGDITCQAVNESEGCHTCGWGSSINYEFRIPI
jgi:hypothetical protein